MFCKICGEFSKKIVKNFVAVTHNSRRFYRTHYETLNVARSCTTKEIKSAFIDLSKKYHPDVNKGKHSQQQFQQIQEAYSVLSSPSKRRNYDLGLPGSNYNNRKVRTFYTEDDDFVARPFRDDSFWEFRDKSQDQYYQNKPYYGIHGINKVSNATIVVLCLILASFGLFLQFLTIKRSFEMNSERLRLKSLEAQKVLNETRKRALENGDEKQIELLTARLLSESSEK